jgi:aminoglycoside 6'-N-acetyltransferase
VSLVIEHEDALVGSIQFVEVLDPNYRTASIDLFISAAAQGRGLGPDAIRAVARYLFEVRGQHHLTIDPAAANERAIRAYHKVGFRPVGVIRAYERGADGSWHDNLLMDLLAGELI